MTSAAFELARKTCDAYSVFRYRSWPNVARLLLKQGFTDEQAEIIMRSKWMRWAADDYDCQYGDVPAKALLPHLDQIREDFQRGRL